MASAIPPILVELQLETANIKAQMAQLNKNFSDFGDTVKQQTGPLQNFKTAALGVFAGNLMTTGLAVLKSGIQGAIKDAQEYERVTNQLKVGLESTGNVAGLSVAGLKAHASALENLSGVDENLIMQSEAVFQTFTNVRNVVGQGNDIFNQASLAALDLSTKMGGDLQGATVQLGKALNDPIKGVTALTRVGVVFTASQKEQIKALVQSGDVMGAQKIILAEMKTEFGGAAAAAGDTFAGAVGRAKDKVADFTRDLILNLQPILLNIGKVIGSIITNYIAPFLKIIKDNKEALLLFVGVLASAYAAFRLYGVILGVVKSAQTLYAVAQVLMSGGQLASIASTNGLAASMLRLNAIIRANPIGLIVTGIALLAAGFVIAWNNSQTFRDGMVKLFQIIINGVGYLVGAIGKMLSVAALIPGIGAAFKGPAKAVNDAANEVRKFSDGLDKLKDKKISIPGFGGSKTKEDDPTGASAPGGGKTAADIKAEKAAGVAKLKQIEADAKAKTKLIATANDDVLKTYANMDKVYADDQIKTAAAQKTRDNSIANAKEINAKAIAKLDAKFLDESAKAYKRNSEVIEAINKDYAKRTIEIEKKLQEKIISLREAAAIKSSDLIEKAADKQAGIIQQSINRLTSAFASKTGASLTDVFSGGASITSALSTLKAKLQASKDLSRNAALLQAQGFSQTFIEQVVSAGPEVGNQLARAIAEASPDTLSEFRATFNELEKVSDTGLDALARSMNSGGKLATQELMDAYAQVSIDLRTSLAEVNSDLLKALADANGDYSQAMTEAKAIRDDKLAEAAKDLTEALAKVNEDYNQALIDVAKVLTDALADIQTTYNDAIDKIAESTDAKITDLKLKLTELAATLAALGAAQASANVMQKTPVFIPPKTSLNVNSNPSFSNRGEGDSKNAGIIITQNIVYPTASKDEISAQTLAAIKFGTSSGYTSYRQGERAS